MQTGNQIVVAVSSRALFDLETENQIFENSGIDAYREFQISNRDVPLEPGVAFPFIRRLLKINELFPNNEPFRVIVLSRNSPETGQRFFNSCRYHHLPIKSGAFTSGQSTVPFLSAFNVSLFLSANKSSVIQSIQQGLPAGWVLPSKFREESDTQDTELRIAFDFDGVIIDDEAEFAYKKSGLEGFQNHETEHSLKPHSPGPLSRLFSQLAQFQKLDALRGKDNPRYRPVVRIAIVTARGAPSEQRLITTLGKLGMSAAELFLMDGQPKTNILRALKPHVFFDDQLSNLENSANDMPCVLIPFGSSQ